MGNCYGAVITCGVGGGGFGDLMGLYLDFNAWTQIEGQLVGLKPPPLMVQKQVIPSSISASSQSSCLFLREYIPTL